MQTWKSCGVACFQEPPKLSIVGGESQFSRMIEHSIKAFMPGKTGQNDLQPKLVAMLLVVKFGSLTRAVCELGASRQKPKVQKESMLVRTNEKFCTFALKVDKDSRFARSSAIETLLHFQFARKYKSRDALESVGLFVLVRLRVGLEDPRSDFVCT